MYGILWAFVAYWYDDDGVIRVNVEEYVVEVLLHLQMDNKFDVGINVPRRSIIG